MFALMNRITEKQRVDVHSKASIDNWCLKLNCSEDELLYCISKVGSSVIAIESYLHMNRSLLQLWSKKDIA